EIGPRQAGGAGGLLAGAFGGLAAELAEAGAHGQLGREAVLLEPLRKAAALLGREAEMELLGQRGRKAAGLEVGAGLRALAAGQGRFEVFTGGEMDAEQLEALGVVVGRRVAGDADAQALGHLLDGFGEADLLEGDQELEDIAMGVAAEAVIEALGGMDVEGGGFFAVEGAEADEAIAAGAEGDELSDDLADVGLGFQLIGE